MPISAPPGLEVRAVEGKGRGVFATRRFRKGALVERSPVIAMPPRQWRSIERTRLGDYVYDWGRDDRGVAMVLGLGSLYNHASDPNVENRWNEALLAMDWVALRAIRPGEEITVDYRDGEEERDPLWFRVR
jgi:SET domain-containing protein